MLPFFRKIRWRLARDNQFLKYSRYAIGEIVLVVIGILIALYINNWNEQRKEREKFDQVLIEVERELISNIEEARTILGDLNYMDSISNRVFFDSLKLNDYKKESNLELNRLGEWLVVFTIDSDSYNKLVEISENINEDQNAAIEGLNELYGRTWDFIQLCNQTTFSAQIKLKELAMNKPWYSEVQLGRYSDDAFQYYAQDPNHKNLVTEFINWQIGNLVFYVNQFETDGRASYVRIHEYLKKTYPEHSEPERFQYNAEDFRPLIGTYVHFWNSAGVEKFADSLVLSIERDTLFSTTYRVGGGHTKRKISPLSKSWYMSPGSGAFVRINFDNQGDVKGFNWSNGLILSKDKKIR